LAAHQGHAKARHELASAYLWGRGVQQDDAEAVKYYRLAAEQGESAAQYAFGWALSHGRGVPQDDAEATKWYQLAADQGNTQAENALGLAYSNGKGVAQDDAEAMKWYRLSAEHGNSQAQTNLGQAYANGKGVQRDDAEAARWYRLAADQGLARAQVQLGLAYSEGRGVAQDDAKAIRYNRLAADQGNSRGQNWLGVAYALGEGVPQDWVAAVSWYRLAAEQGNSSAQVNLGMSYKWGNGVPEHDSEAVKWFRLAADQGYARGQWQLAWMYRRGEGVTQNDVEAYFWANLASVSFSAARDLRDKVRSDLSPLQISEAQSRAAQWKPGGDESGGDTTQWVTVGRTESTERITPRDSYRESTHNSSSRTGKQDSGGVSVTEALAEGHVTLLSLEGTGSNYGTLVQLRNNRSSWLRLVFNPGVAVIPRGRAGSSIQRMVVARTIDFLLKPEERKAVELHTYCLDADKSPPSRSSYSESGVAWTFGMLQQDAVPAFLRSLEAAISDVASEIQLDEGDGRFRYPRGALTDQQVHLATCVPWSQNGSGPTADLDADLALQVAIWVVSSDLMRISEQGSHSFRSKVATCFGLKVAAFWRRPKQVAAMCRNDSDAG
jgi:TPR repeat protein